MRAAHMVRTHVLRFGTAHEAVSQVGIIYRMLRKQVPTKVLVIERGLFRWVWASVSNMPDVPRKAALVHGLTDATIASVAHAWHHHTVELAYASKLFTFDWEAAE